MAPGGQRTVDRDHGVKAGGDRAAVASQGGVRAAAHGRRGQGQIELGVWVPMSREPVPIGDEIARTFRARGWAQRLEASRVVARWPDVVGEAVAAHCRPVRLEDDGTLLVTADSAAWATQLAYLQGTLLDRINRICGPGAVVAVRVRTDDQNARGRWRRR
jgi:predicted nucleic acid-binding Zn ribbon protein